MRTRISQSAVRAVTASRVLAVPGDCGEDLTYHPAVWSVKNSEATVGLGGAKATAHLGKKSRRAEYRPARSLHPTIVLQSTQYCRCHRCGSLRFGSPR